MKQILIILCLFVVCSAAGQRIISGHTVTADGAAIEGVSITIEGTSVGTTSNREGEFSLRIPARFSNNTLSVTHVAYNALRRPVATLKNDEIFTLTQRSLEAEEVLVEGRRARKETLDMRGNRTMTCVWSFRTELIEFGSFIEVEDKFLVDNFQFKILKDAETKIQAELVVYRMEGDYMIGVLKRPVYVWFDRPPLIITETEQGNIRAQIDAYSDFDYRRKPFPMPVDDKGFIEYDESLAQRNEKAEYLVRTGQYISDDETLTRQQAITQARGDFLTGDKRDMFPITLEYDFLVNPNEELILEKGRYFVSLKLVSTPDNLILLNSYPWVFPQIGAFNEAGMSRHGHEFHFEDCDRNAGIIVRGYGK